MKRSSAAQHGRETLQILKAGQYRTPTGESVDIRDRLQRAVAATCTYPPDLPLPVPSFPTRNTHFEVVNESTLAAARRLVVMGHRTVALNFASAKNPGGGFLGGARAQEESLARSSGLYACIEGNPMYAFHRAQHDPLYTNYAIYSPDVPVFREDDGTLFAPPFCCAFITSPAVNVTALRAAHSVSQPVVREAMRERIDKVLTIAALHEHQALVLGAWGCGVFGNDCAEIAELFHTALLGQFRGAFAHVVFAILDWSAEQKFLGPFQRAFHEQRC
jgi:uncharacterized protein (TIGR02452 family)